MLHDDAGAAGGWEAGRNRPDAPSHRTERDPLRFAELWFDAQCDDRLGDGLGFRIEAVDGPAWRVTIDLRSTLLEDVVPALYHA